MFYVQRAASSPNATTHTGKATMRIKPVVISLALLGALTSGCTRPINRTAERHIRDALPGLLGPAKQYRVHVDSAPMQTIQGRLADVTVDGDHVQLSNGLLLDTLHLDIKGVDVNTSRGQIRSIREARFSTTVGEASVDAYLANEAATDSSIRKAHVRFGDDNIVTLAAERVTLRVGVPFSVSGPVRVSSPQHIQFDPQHLTVLGIGIGGTSLRLLTSRFEKGIDLSKLPLPIRLIGIRTAPGELTLDGTADVAEILRQARAGQH